MHPPESVISGPSRELKALPPPQRSGLAAEATAAFLLRLRAKGVRDLAVLRALEAVPRELFVPHRYADLAAKDVALPIPCGQVMSEPFVVARMAEALALKPTSRVLEIGGGSGYACAILARLAREVLSFERYHSLAAQARAHLDVLGIANASVVWGDGHAVPPEAGDFDRLLVHAVLPDGPAAFATRMAADAVMVYAESAPDGTATRQRLVRARRSGGGAWTVDPIGPSRLRPLGAGISRGL